jgi:hypothetical protein
MSRMNNEAIERALVDPQSVFARPADVVEADGPSADEKLKILRQWEADAREMLVATEENMGGGEDPLLDEVVEAIARIGPVSAGREPGATKHGV